MRGQGLLGAIKNVKPKTFADAFRFLAVDGSTHSLQTVTYEHHEIHSGSHYYNIQSVNVPANDVLDIRMTTPNTTKWLHLVGQVITEAEFLFTWYNDGTIVNPGTSLNARNSNHNIDNTSGLTAFDYIVNVDLAAANVDTTVAAGGIQAGPFSTGSGRSIGGALQRGSEIVLKQNSTYVWRFENQNAATKYVAWEFEWYEHTNREPIT